MLSVIQDHDTFWGGGVVGEPFRRPRRASMVRHQKSAALVVEDCSREPARNVVAEVDKSLSQEVAEVLRCSPVDEIARDLERLWENTAPAWDFLRKMVLELGGFDRPLDLWELARNAHEHYRKPEGRALIRAAMYLNADAAVYASKGKIPPLDMTDSFLSKHLMLNTAAMIASSTLLVSKAATLTVAELLWDTGSQCSSATVALRWSTRSLKTLTTRVRLTRPNSSMKRATSHGSHGRRMTDGFLPRWLRDERRR